MTNKVYIVCEPFERLANGTVPRVNLAPAADWGEPVVLLPYSQISLDATAAVAAMRQRMISFTDDDYLVPIGDPVLMCAAAALAAFLNNGRVKMLKWDRKRKSGGAYVPIQLTL